MISNILRIPDPRVISKILILQDIYMCNKIRRVCVFNSQSPWETNSHSASQGIPCLLWELKVPYHVHKRPHTSTHMWNMSYIQIF